MTYRTLSLLACLASAALAEVDVFGLTRLMPSASPLVEWNSAHWAKGQKRTLVSVDPEDPTGWSRKRGNGTLMEIDGAGMLRMGGDQPRIYFQSSAASKVFFLNVEFTGYFRRVGSDGATNGGFNVGVRSSENGHGEVDHCLASTYYLGFRYPGTWVFYKELDHPNGATGKSGRLLAGNAAMPAGKWIGMKYLSYNIPGRNAVKLEAYLDTVSGGDPVRGGTWTKVAEIIDEGNWTAPTGTCTMAGNMVITRGGGVVFIRNTGAAEAQYKMVSVREITLPTTALQATIAPRSARRLGGSVPTFWTFGDRDTQGRRILGGSTVEKAQGE